MSYLADLLVGQRVPLVANRNIPVALCWVNCMGRDGAVSVGHVLVNSLGRTIGRWSSDHVRPKMDGKPVFIRRTAELEKSARSQVLLVNTYALMELLPTHPSSLLALEHGGSAKWKEMGDNVGKVDIPLLYPHFIPVNADGLGLEGYAGLRGYRGDGDSGFQTAVSTDAGQMAYAAMVEPMLEKVARLVLEPNGFRDCDNPFMAYIRRGNDPEKIGYHGCDE